jgi:hypothetical protein
VAIARLYHSLCHNLGTFSAVRFPLPWKKEQQIAVTFKKSEVHALVVSSAVFFLAS